MLKLNKSTFIRKFFVRYLQKKFNFFIPKTFIETNQQVEKYHCKKWRLMDGCRYKSNCPLVGPGTIGGLPSVGGD